MSDVYDDLVAPHGEILPQYIAEVIGPMIQVRFDGDEMSLINAAARLSGMTLSEFIRHSVSVQARQYAEAD